MAYNGDDYKNVTEDEFREYLSSYDGKLDRDVNRAGDPPLVTYNDFSRGAWPDSIVAMHFAAFGRGYPASGWRVLK